jgi:hypothetical protein
MDFYNYNLDLPFSNKKIYFRELNTNEQLLITKANISFSKSINDLKDYHFYILDIILNCIKNKEDFLNINIIEYVLFLLKLRILSVGHEIEFMLNNTKNKTKLKVDLKQYMFNLYEISKVVNEESYIIDENGIKIKINWPFLKTISDFNTKSENQIEEYRSFENTLIHFVEYIIIKELKMDFLNLSNDQKTDILNKLPATFKSKIEKLILNLLENLMSKNLFDFDFLKDYKFNIYNMIFVEHIKIIFSYDLRSLYKEIYYLAANNISPEYVLKISDFERKTFLSIIQEENKKPEDEDPENIQYSDAVKKLAIEYNQDLSK